MGTCCCFYMSPFCGPISMTFAIKGNLIKLTTLLLDSVSPFYSDQPYAKHKNKNSDFWLLQLFECHRTCSIKWFSNCYGCYSFRLWVFVQKQLYFSDRDITQCRDDCRWALRPFSDPVYTDDPGEYLSAIEVLGDVIKYLLTRRQGKKEKR